MLSDATLRKHRRGLRGIIYPSGIKRAADIGNPDASHSPIGTGAAMQLWMNVRTEYPGLALRFAAARAIIEPAFNARFGDTGHDTGLVELRYLALLHPPRQPLFGEAKKYSKALHAVEISSRVEMPLSCSTQDMVERLAVSIAHSLDRLLGMPIRAFDLERFAADYNDFAVRQHWIAAHSRTSSSFHLPSM